MTLNEPDLLQNLMKTLDFTAEDLALNRTGRVSDHQVDKLRHSARNLTLRVAGLGLLFGGVLVIGGFITNDKSLGNLFIGAGVASALVLWLLGAFLLRGRLAEIESLQGTVTQPPTKLSTLEGPGQKYKAGGRRTPRVWYCKIGDLTFEIPFTAAVVLVAGLTYQAYYTPSSNLLLSLEPKTPQPAQPSNLP